MPITISEILLIECNSMTVSKQGMELDAEKILLMDLGIKMKGSCNELGKCLTTRLSKRKLVLRDN